MSRISRRALLVERVREMRARQSWGIPKRANKSNRLEKRAIIFHHVNPLPKSPELVVLFSSGKHKAQIIGRSEDKPSHDAQCGRYQASGPVAEEICGINVDLTSPDSPVGLAIARESIHLSTTQNAEFAMEKDPSILH